MTKADYEHQVAPPKRPLSAFFLYKGEKYPLFTAEHPNMKIAEITQIISNQWNAESDEKKAIYQASYQVAKVHFDREMQDYIDVYGKPVRKQKKVKKVKGGKAENKEMKPIKEKKPKKEKQPKSETNIVRRVSRDRTNESADTQLSK